MFRIFRKKFYWYRLRFTYRNKENKTILIEWTSTYGFKSKRLLLDLRNIKRDIGLDLSVVPKHILCNGILQVEPIFYIGKLNNYESKEKSIR